MHLPGPFAKKEIINAIIETPKGSRNKYDYNPDSGIFELDKILPAGTCFPLDFGFIPGTLGDDGDPLDVLVLIDTPAHTGCLVQCRVVGVIEATQKEKGKKIERNDRLIAVATASHDHAQLKDIGDVNEHLLSELIHFFEYYNSMCDKKFKFLGAKNAKAAIRLIKHQTTASKK